MHLIACKLIVLDKNTWSHIIVYKLFVLDWYNYLKLHKDL